MQRDGKNIFKKSVRIPYASEMLWLLPAVAVCVIIVDFYYRFFSLLILIDLITKRRSIIFETFDLSECKVRVELSPRSYCYNGRSYIIVIIITRWPTNDRPRLKV